MELGLFRQTASTTRSRLLLVAAILAPLAVFAIVVFSQFSSAERARYRADAEQLAQQLSDTVDRELIAFTAALEALATSPALAPGGDLADFHQQALRLLQTRGFAIAIRDRTGQQMINTMVPFGESLPRATDPVLLAADQAVFETGRPVISDLFVGTTNKLKLLLVDAPVFRRGRVEYALNVAIAPARLSAILAGASRPGWTISLIDRNDLIVASSRQNPDVIGRKATADLRQETRGVHGTWNGTTLEGTVVLGAYARSPLSGWRVAVGVPLSTIEAPLQRLTMIVASSAILVGLLALALALRVAGTISAPIAQLATAADRLGRGEPVPSVHTGLLEVDEVAGALAAAEEAVSTRETALQASEERFRAAVRAVEGVIWTNDAAGRMAGDQPGWAALTGQSYEEYQGHGWTSAIHPEDVEPTVRAWERAVRERRTFVFEHRVRRRDDVYRQFSVRAVPVTGAGGEVNEWVGVHTDVTAEFEAKASLAESQARLRDLNATLERRVQKTSEELDRIWRISTELMLVARFDAEIVAINPAWANTLGWVESDLRGAPLIGLVHPDDVTATLAEGKRIEEGATTLRYENRLRHKDGSYRWLSWTAVPEAGLVHAIARDVTAEKAAAEALRRTEEQLRQSQKMEVVGQLTGGVAHDFNNLLTVVTGHIEMARRRVERGGGDPRLLRNMGAALEGARRAAVLTHRLLAFSRQSPLRPQAVDLNAIIDGMADLIRRTLGETIRIETRFADELWPAEADRNQIENAILNLCVNARDAMPDGGVLRIETSNRALDRSDDAVARGEVPPGSYAMIAVADDGTGIAPEIQDRVFEPFFTTKPVGKGTGLGLSQVFGFLRQSGGHAAIESTPGEGTTVRLFFPRLTRTVEHAPADREPAPAPARPGGGETCLVIEDQDMVREFAVSALEEAGYRVIAASDGPSGLDLLDAHAEVALVFTDIVLTGPLDGHAVAAAAMRRRPDLKVLLTTGYTRDAGILEGRLGGDVEIITKPFTAAALAAKIQALFRQA